MLSLRWFLFCQTHTFEIESVEADLACCMNQRQLQIKSLLASAK